MKRTTHTGHSEAETPDRVPTRRAKVLVEPSRGNVFEDLGFPDSDERLAKAMLARVVRTTIRDRKWTQKHAAEVLGVAAPDISDLMRGKLARFSQERLERFLNALDFDVHIRIGPRPAWKRHADVSVEVVSTF